MKVLVISDIHGSSYYAKKIKEINKKEEPDKIIVLGDLYYHGPRNDLPKEYAPKQVIAMLNEYKDRIYAVRGNCDAEVDQMVLEFPILADYAVFPAADRLIYATHGHHFHMNQLPPLQPGDILLHGHTHIPAWEPFGDGNLYLNPGSVSIPKAESEHSYMLLQDGKVIWKTLEGTAYHSECL